MNAERDPRRGQVRLPAFAESADAEWQAPEAGGPALAGRPGKARRAGIRQGAGCSGYRLACVRGVAEREVGLVFLCRVQSQDGVQAVQDAA
jgi:hypothetical protein